MLYWASQVALVVKNLPANAGDARDTVWSPGLGRPSDQEWDKEDRKSTRLNSSHAT